VSRRPIAILVACLLLAGCRAEEKSDAGNGFTPVTLVPVAAVDVVERIEATGQLLAKERAEIAAEVDGQITEVMVDEGAAVEAGSVVLTIDPERRTLARDSARARVNEARAALREQQREHDRMIELRGRKVASQTSLDQAETQLVLAKSRLLAAEAEFGMAERALRDANVDAPFAGLIAERFVSRGEFVSAGRRLFELISLDPIEVEFRLTEADSGRVALGQIVAFRVAPFPDEVFEGEVTVIAPTIDEKSRTLRVKACVDNPEGRLRPGLFARTDLGIAEREGVIVIPEEAVLQRADGPVVFRAVADARVERVVVETGAYHDGQIEIVRGLAAGDRIVLRGHFRLSDGQRVSARTVDGEPVDGAIPEVAGSPP
jgi:membrane fusion protein (multidrug efflux system)